MVHHSGNLIDSAVPRSASVQPHIEVITATGGQEYGPRPAWHRARRLRVFLLVFLLVLVPGLAWDFLRPAQYRATATLLTQQPPVSIRGQVEQGPDVQHVSIQGRLLLTPELLTGTLERAGREVPLTVSSPDELERMLKVTPVPDTNLVELSAVGNRPEELAPLINAWVDGYLDFRQQELEREIGNTLDALREEHESLGETIGAKTEALERFRGENDIITLERDGNEALARLKSLQDALNRARDEVVEAEARLAATEAAVARGDPIVPSSEQGVLEELEARAAELRSKQIALEKRFLPLFLENHPEHRVIPAQIEALEAQIEQKLAQGRKLVLALGAREVQQGRQRVEVLERELAGQKKVAARFTDSFAKYQSMQTDLERLQEMHQEAGARVVELEAKGLEKYPPVEVVNSAHRPAYPFHPRYWRDALRVLLGALGAAIAAVWLSEYLTRRPRDQDAAAPVTGVRVYAADPAAALGSGAPSPMLQAAGPAPAIARPEAASLPEALPRELIPAEVQALWDLAEPMSRQLIALLLSGLTLDECARLRAEHFDEETGRVRAPDPSAREITLSSVAKDLFARSSPLPLWAGDDYRQTPADLDGRIGLLAHDAGLAHPGEVTAQALRHSYIAYLVRQGTRLTELERLIGAMPAAQLTRYAAFAPAGQAKPLAEVQTTYPGLKNSR